MMKHPSQCLCEGIIGVLGAFDMAQQKIFSLNPREEGKCVCINTLDACGRFAGIGHHDNCNIFDV
jgi:hypothetical protein